MEKIEKIQKVLEAALFEEDALVESYADQKKDRIAAEHFHRARGILYAIQLITDPYYLRKQAEILDVDKRPATEPYDMSERQADEIRNDGRYLSPAAAARRRNAVG